MAEGRISELEYIREEIIQCAALRDGRWKVRLAKWRVG